MTALAGCWGRNGVADSRAGCEAMLNAQGVYAPDAIATIVTDGECAFGRRLHRTLPEDVFDDGPVVDARGRVLVADVRIDNRTELCGALGLDGRRMSDAALLSHALLRWDEGALGRIVGDFAFALWDGAARRLLLARDFAGQRPLHYHADDGIFAFASMPKGLHALRQVPRAPDPDAAADFLAHLPESDGASFFQGISKIPPGHFAVATSAGVTTHRYWHPPAQTLRLASADDYAEALRAHLDTAVAARLRGAEGRVATHLSGGLDSSAVTATAARLTPGRVTAYTAVPRAGFVDADARVIVDEGPLAAAAAAMYANIDHVPVCTSGRSPLDALARNAFLYERPYLNLCNGVWVDAINDDARARGLTVLLVGAMGNAGFSYHGMHRLGAMARHGHLAALVRQAAMLRRRGTGAGTIAAAAFGPLLPRKAWAALGTWRGRPGLSGYSAIRAEAARDPALLARARDRGTDFAYQPTADPRGAQISLLGRVDFGNYIKGTLGGWGIDVRDPMSDRRLIEFCLSVPADQYLADGVPRALARRALADRLPAAVTGELRKGWQAADWYEGLSAARAVLAAEISAMAQDAVAARLIDTERMQAMIDHWPNGTWDQVEMVEHYRLALLRGISTGHFLRTAAGTN